MIKIQTTKENIESKGGLFLAGKVAIKAGLRTIKSALVNNAAAVIISMYALMLEGKSTFESTGEKRYNHFFKEAFGLPFVYAKETVRLYLEKMSDDAEGIINQLRESSINIIQKAPMNGIWIDKKQYLPVDIDTVALDNSKSKKEGVSRTYRGFDGYHPIMAYVGKEGYMLDCELRPGSQHCQNETPEFIEGVMEQLKKIQRGGRFLFRLDSGNDAWETLKKIVSAGEEYYCIIKRNNRRENEEKWLETAKKGGVRTEPRKGKKVWVGRTKNIHPQTKDEYIPKINCVYEVIERKTDSKGTRFLIPEIEVNLWWTNLDCGAEKVIELYHSHATSEQFHSELKHDMDIERLPSGKFAVNKILLAVAMNAYNTLRFLGQKSVEPDSRAEHRRKRLGKVISDIICIGGKFIKHAGCLILKIYEKNPVLPVFIRLNAALDCL